MGINPACRAAIHVLASRCLSHLVSLPWSAITRLNLRRGPKQVYWSREQFGKIGRHALSRENFGQRLPEKRLVLQGRGPYGQEKIKSIWLFDQLKFRGR
jgi:hypothetical protein